MHFRRLDAPTGYLWWMQSGALCFRKRDWFTQQRYEVPDRWTLSLLEARGPGEVHPRGTELLRAGELTLSQVVGLNSWARQTPVTEREYLGLDELLTLIRSTGARFEGPLPKGERHNGMPGLPGQVTLERRSRSQQQTLERLASLQYAPVAPELLEGLLRLRLYRQSDRLEGNVTG